jgi:WhiB family redox-sensing transcriptional regulator
VQKACLEYSLTVQEPHGIWGGLNELERRRLLRKRAAEAQQRSA